MHRAKTALEFGKGSSDRDGEHPEPSVPLSNLPLLPLNMAGSPWKLPQLLLFALLALSTLVIVDSVLRTQRDAALVPVSSFSIVHTYSSSNQNGGQRVETTTRAVATQYVTTTTTATTGATVNMPRKGSTGWSAVAHSEVGSSTLKQHQQQQQQQLQPQQQQQQATGVATEEGRAKGAGGQGDGRGINRTAGGAPDSSEDQQTQRRSTPARSTAPIPPPTRVPDDFDWRAYLNFYPGLRRKGIDTKVKAERHWLKDGYHERRLYKPLRIILRYTACGGLSNQQYSHIAALTLASHLNASLIFPPALTRNSFASYFNMNPALNRVSWRATPADSMWDVDFLRTFWKVRGMEITLAPVDAPAPDLTRPETAFPTTLPAGFTGAQVARLRNVYLSSKSLDALLRQATDAIVATGTNMPDREAPLLLDLPCTLFMIRTKTAPRVIKQAADSLRFHPRMHAIADTVIERLQLPAGGFNGLHLRMEDDAQDWANILGGRDKLLNMYLDACEEAGFDSDTPVYLASGLFTYGKMDAYKHNIVTRLKEYSSKLQYKEEVLTKADTKGLTKEQLALLDFLVLARSSQFVGIGVSTFSHFLREYRNLQGMPKNTSVLVDGSVIGTDDLFNSCAYITELPPPSGPATAAAPSHPPDAERRKQASKRQLLAQQIISETCGF